MDWKFLGAVFVSVFIAEMGDKTQLATMLFAADKEVSKLTVFFGASPASVATSAISALAGSALSEYAKVPALCRWSGAHHHRRLDPVESLSKRGSIRL